MHTVRCCYIGQCGYGRVKHVLHFTVGQHKDGSYGICPYQVSIIWLMYGLCLYSLFRFNEMGQIGQVGPSSMTRPYYTTSVTIFLFTNFMYSPSQAITM